MPERYFAQVLAARGVGLGMTRVQAEAFRRLLEAYAEDLASRISAGVARRGELHALQLAREMIRQLTRDLALATRSGVVITSDRVSRIYAEATFDLLGRSGSGLVIETLFDGLGSRAAQATLSRPELSAAFKSIRSESVATVDGIVHRALLRGATTSQLAHELRLHILGSDAFPDRFLLDRRRIGHEALRQMGYEETSENLTVVRQEAGRISARAELIARTEIMAAEHEAHIQGAIESPVVKAIRWRLSSRHPHYDVCDILAEQDLYGLGPGLYDPRQVPPRPHPRDLCFQEDVLVESMEELQRGRGPLPRRRVEVADVIQPYELPPSQERMLGRALAVGERRMRDLAAA